MSVAAWNRSPDKAAALAGDGVRLADSPAAAAAGADVVLTIVADADAVIACMEGERGAASAMDASAAWIQLSTIGEIGTDECARLAADRDLLFFDAPVLGTRQPAEQGALTVFAAGPDAARPVLAPVFDAIGRKTVWLGTSPGTASRLKLVVNSWVLAVTTGVAEALALARGLDIDPDLFLQAVAGGPLDCAYLQSKAAAILSGDFTANFSVALAGKDARLVTEAGTAAGVRLDVAPAVADRFRRAAELGHADEDMAATYFASFGGG